MGWGGSDRGWSAESSESDMDGSAWSISLSDISGIIITLPAYAL